MMGIGPACWNLHGNVTVCYMELHCMLYAVWSYKRVIFFILKFDIVSILFRAFNFMDIVFASSYYHFEKQIITLVPIFYGNSREKVLWKLLLLLFPYMNIKHSLSLFFSIWFGNPSLHHSKTWGPNFPDPLPGRHPLQHSPTFLSGSDLALAIVPPFLASIQVTFPRAGELYQTLSPQTMALVFIRLPWTSRRPAQDALVFRSSVATPPAVIRT